MLSPQLWVSKKKFDGTNREIQLLKEIMMTNVLKGSAIGVVLSMSILFFITIAHAGQSSYSIPVIIDKTANYLFFFHNYYVEINGPDGDCRYLDLLNAFAEEEVVVVSELRTRAVSPIDYAKKAVLNVQTLLNAGVPPENISISGHSKGGVIVLQMAALLQQADIRFIILAGCGITPLAYAYPDPLTIKGDFLSLFASSDKIAGSCNALLSSSRQGVSVSEVVLDSSYGHRLFFKPDSLWLAPVAQMLEK